MILLYLKLLQHVFLNPPLTDFIYGLFHSHLAHAKQLWSFASSTTLQPVRILQELAIWIIASTHQFSHTKPVANNFNILLLDDYITNCKFVFVYKIFHDLFPNCIANTYRRLFHLNIRSYELHFDGVNFSVCDTVNSSTRKLFLFAVV